MTTDRRTWTVDRIHFPKANGKYKMSEHAERRMYSRGMDPEEVRRALCYGRVIRAQGTAYFVLGKNEVDRYDAVDPEDNGLQLVVSGLKEGTIITLYRNREELPRP